MISTTRTPALLRWESDDYAGTTVICLWFAAEGHDGTVNRIVTKPQAQPRDEHGTEDRQRAKQAALAELRASESLGRDYEHANGDEYACQARAESQEQW